MEIILSKLILFLFKLNYIEETQFSPSNSSSEKDCYIFHNENDFYNYFEQNGIIQSKDTLDLAMLLKINKTIIAYKKVCDYIIEEFMDVNMDGIYIPRDDCYRKSNNPDTDNKRLKKYKEKR